MKDGHFINIAGWMGNRLELRGNELICFALIYSFSQDGESQFRGKLDFLAGCMFATRKTALSIIDKLLGLNLILKIEEMVNGKKRCYYQTNIIYDKGEFSVINNEKKPLTAIGKESIPVTGVNSIPETGVESIPETGVESIPVYNNNKDIDNKKSINKKVPNGTKKENAHFQKPTVQEVEAYIKEKGYHFDAERFMSHYESIGWMVGTHKMKDWKAACSTWEKKQKTKLYYEPNPNDSDELKRFKAWMRENHAEIEFTEVPLTLDGYKRLQKDYGRDEVCNQLDYIDANIGKFRQCDIEKSIIQYFERA